MRAKILTICFLALIVLQVPSLAAEQAVTFEYQSTILQNYMRDIRFDGDIGYCSYSNGLKVYDFSDPTNPVLISEFDHGQYKGMAMEFDFYGNYLYLPISNVGILIIDNSDPYNLTEAGFYPIADFLMEVKQHNGYLYLAKRLNDAVVFDLVDPVNPVEISSLSTGSRTTIGLDIAGDILGLVHYYYGIRFYDISDPTNPEYLSVYDPYGNESDLKIVGNIAYVTGRGYGLSIVDISNPSYPTQIGQYDPVDDEEYIEGAR
ncbi:MAG: hypothetical protein KAR42_02930 [candidate division Zixibacteria bacterium]|nr:hypothetical protein [candidate division Zixibacteria bacterium]